MGVVVPSHLKAKPEAFEALTATLAAILPDTRAFDGCRGIHACANPGDHSALVYEGWDSKAHQEKYMDWRAKRGDLDKLATLLREAPTFATRVDAFSA